MFVLCILAIGAGATWVALTQPATAVGTWFDTWIPAFPALFATYAVLYVLAWKVETGGFRSTQGEK